jgi:phosphoglycolate phosphatase
MPNYDLIAFDCDGTLTDTLPNHIKWCNNANSKRGYNLPQIDPKDINASKKIVGSPMSAFIRNYGFPEADISELVNLYEQAYSQDISYTSSPFPGISGLLRKIKKQGVPIGLVTLNVTPNVVRDLGFSTTDIDIIFTKPSLEKLEWKKADALKWMKKQTRSNNPVYIGDTSGDKKAAEEAGFAFIWPTYGWETPDKNQILRPESVSELGKLLGIEI